MEKAYQSEPGGGTPEELLVDPERMHGLAKHQLLLTAKAHLTDRPQLPALTRQRCRNVAVLLQVNNCNENGSVIESGVFECTERSRRDCHSLLTSSELKGETKGGKSPSFLFDVYG